jgi:hypothetical protein
MTPPRLDVATARRLFLHRQGLADAPGGPVTGAELLSLIERLGFVQVDSIVTVERAHHMILSARRTGYRPAKLKALLERDRSLFEHWTHDAAVIPTAFFPHWTHRFERARARLPERWRKWHGPGALDEADTVLDAVRARGAVLARDVGEAPPRKGAGWWDWHPSKTALEFHWHTGSLAVARREGFQKVFDLTERVIPEAHRAHRPSAAESLDWACSTALDRLGFATAGEIAAFWRAVSNEEAAAWVAAGLAAGRLVDVIVEGAGAAAPRRAVLRPEALDTLAGLAPAPSRLRVLSPFDPALRDRARTERLFGFHYRIEVFVPEAKRRFGYYVFPLLEGERLVARIDMRARRDEGVLAVRALWPEPGVSFGAARLRRLGAELHRVARFAGCDRVAFADDWLREPVAATGAG